jgi:O-antigen/teichoic acid export membrane protein
MRGAALLAIASISEASSAFLVGVVIAREGGPEALGRLAAALALLLAGVTATELGQNVVLTRRAAAGRPDARAGLGASFVVKATGGLLLAPAAVALWPAGEARWGVPVALAHLVLSSWTISATAVLKGRERFGSVTSASLAGAVTGVGGIAWFRPSNLAGALAVLAVAQAVKAALAFRALPPGSQPERPAPGEVQALLAETLPFAAAVGVGVAYLKADVLLLTALAGAEEAGRYAAAVRLTEALKLIPTALGAALLPALVAGRRREWPRALAAAVATGIAVVVGAGVFGETVLATAFGSGFAAAVGPLRLLSLAFLAGSVNALLIVALYARGRERDALRALASALAVNVALNLWLIPARGAWGAAAASVVSEALLVLFYVGALRRAGAREPVVTGGWVTTGGGVA